MAEENIRTTMQFQADITDFKSAMQEANRAVKLANSEFKAVSSGMDDWSGSTDGLAAKLRQLGDVHDAEKRKLDVLQVAYQQTVAEQGAASAAAVDLQTKINNQQAVVNEAQKKIETYADKLKELQDGAGDGASDLGKLGDAAKRSGDDAEDGADGWSIMKGVVADFISNTISGAIEALKSAAEATREYRRDMAQMAQNAADAGQDMGAMKDVLKDVAAVTGETDAAMEGLNMLMATGLDTTNLTNAAEAFAGAATKFDGLKFEGLAEGLQESLAVGQAVGPFAELIERMGGDLEAFNEGMAACTTQAEKQQYAMKWLNESGLQEVHDSYVQNNADLVEAEKAQFRHNEAMAKLGAVIEPINTALTNLGAIIMEKVAPVVESIITWVQENLPTIAPIITGIAVALGVLATALAIKGIIDGVSKAWVFLNTTMLANPIVLIVAAIAGLVAAFVALWNKSEAFRNFWINLWEGIKNAFASVADWLTKTMQNTIKIFSDAWKKAGEWLVKTIVNIVTSFQNAWAKIKNAWGKVGEWFSGIWSKITGVFSGVASWFGDIFGKAWSGITNAFSGVSSFFSGIWSKIKSVFSIDGMLSIGKNLVSGLWNGISNSFQWIKDKISGWVGNVMSFIKGLFGIKSPSRVMRDEVGKMLGLGMAEGIEESRNAVNGAVRKLGDAALGGLSPVGGGGPRAAAGGVGAGPISFTQINNSPRALSRREIYRQTNNLLAFAGGVK